MIPRTEDQRRQAWRRIAIAAVLVTPLVALAMAALAADRAKDNNPHGDFREDCALCHEANAWKPARISPKFDHGKFGFELAGAHAAADCRSCHSSLEFRRTEPRCGSCHEDPHLGEFGTDCARCHGSRSFVDRAPMVQAHQLTAFPLTGFHATLDCETCHPPAAQGQMQFLNTQADCQSCHMKDYNAARDPDHRGGGFPTECATCHNSIGWKTATFDHSLTAFPLSGAHRSVACMSCHGDGVYNGKNTACVSCHQGDYDRTTEPEHRSAGFSTNCITCHTTTAWGGSPFDHSLTAFPLTGAHQSAACMSCHGDGVYDGKSTACVSCHQADYDGTSDPNHRSAGFSTNCMTCHSTITWGGAVFDHSMTGFPLTGAHQAAVCASCHGDGVYQGKSAACISCHRADYDGTTNPAHAAAGFNTDCVTCHSTVTWTGATFDHDTNFFPIHSGAHNGKWDACSDCHTNPTNLSVFTCLTCHPHSDRAKTDGDHNGESGYQYESNACFSCHPRGRS